MLVADNNLLKRLDEYAYNRPDVLPAEIKRADKAAYRVYYHFIKIIYFVYKKGILSSDELKKIKADFLNDFLLYELYVKAAIKPIREFQKLDAALIECRKNRDKCVFCKGVSEIYGAETRENELDIDIKPYCSDADGQEGGVNGT